MRENWANFSTSFWGYAGDWTLKMESRGRLWRRCRGLLKFGNLISFVKSFEKKRRTNVLSICNMKIWDK